MYVRFARISYLKRVRTDARTILPESYIIPAKSIAAQKHLSELFLYGNQKEIEFLWLKKEHCKNHCIFVCNIVLTKF